MKINNTNAVTCVDNSANTISTNIQNITYTAYHQPATITENNNELTYGYGPDYQRKTMELKQGSTILQRRIYLGDFEIDATDLYNPKGIHYINSPAGLVAIVVQEGITTIPFTIYTDHLGSIVKATNGGGGVVAEQNFDAWGRHRNPTDWTYNNLPTNPWWLYRGYTGHEHLPEFGLINMNGRMYDPVLGRMLSVDNYVADNTSTQAYNRYTYANNNPLKFVDPDGEFALSLVLGPVGVILDAVLWSVAIDAAVQGMKISSGLQSNFNWAQLGATAIGSAVGAGLGFAAPAGISGISNLFLRYAARAGYAGLTAFTSSTFATFSYDVFNGGGQDFKWEDYRKNGLKSASIAIGISAAYSISEYITWDRFSYSERLAMINNEFGADFHFDNTRDGYGWHNPNNNQVALTKKGLSSKPIARNTAIHELKHRTQYINGKSINAPSDIRKFMNQTIDKTGKAYHPNRQFREYQAHMLDMKVSSSQNLQSRYWFESRAVLYDYGYFGKVPKTLRLNNVLSNLFR